MDDGDAAYEAEEPDEEAELGFIGALEGEGSAKGQKDEKEDEEETGGEGAHRSSPGAGSSTDRPQAKAKAGSTSSTPVGLRMANTSVLNKLQERRRELEESLEKEQAKGDDAEPGEVSKLQLMLDQVRDQIKRAQELKKSKGEGMSARLKADLAAGRNARLAGRNARLAKRKEKSRQRAALHRQSLRKAQAEARVGREEALERRFNVPSVLCYRRPGGQVAAPPSRRKKSMLRGRPEEREHSGDELDEPKERDWSVRPVKMTPEGREGKKRQEARRKARATRRCAKRGFRVPQLLAASRFGPCQRSEGLRGRKSPASRRDLHLSPRRCRFHLPGHGTGATVRSGVADLTEEQKRKVREAIASAPWHREPKTKTGPSGESVGEQAQPAVLSGGKLPDGPPASPG